MRNAHLLKPLQIRFVNAVHFGADGLPRLQRVPIQTFAIGRGLEVPHLTSVFHTPAPTNYLVVRLRRSGATLIAHFPIQPRAARRPPVCANVLVCRADEAFQGYVDCDAGDFVRARIAAGL